MLNILRDKLNEIDKNVFYGVAGSVEDVGNIWNYIVFGRSVMRPNDTKTAFTDVYKVAVVRENYIPEGLIDDVINKVEECGLRLSDDDAEYEYSRKNDDTAVEMLILTFCKSKRRC